MKPYITRIAPSPTGDFHIGTARTAYFNWLAARASGGQFLLRIDDTDAERNNPESVQVIHDCLDWMGLNADAPAVFQSSRTARYLELADNLLDNGKAMRAENGAILLKDGQAQTWTDLIGGSQVPGPKHQELVASQVLVRGDGAPVYHFASVVDDIDMNVNLVIRGADHHTNTFRHSAIYHALGADLPEFAHVGLIMANKKKLSKRDEAASLLGYRDSGVDARAMLNFLLRMGWGPSIDDQTAAMIDKDRAVSLFLTGGKMKSSPSTLDLAKLKNYDKKYKRLLSQE